MPRPPTPDILGAAVRARTPDDASLNAMFGPARDALQRDAGLQDIPVDLIDDNPYQPRTDYVAIEELAADIQRNGLLQAPKGRRMADGRVQLQYGHRRLRAVRHLGWRTMPVEIQSIVEDRDMAIRAWVENHNRQDFSALDQAKYFRRLMDDGWTQQQIADQLGLARPTISNAVRLLKLPDDIQTQVAANGLSARQAEAILSLVDLPAEIRQKAERHWATSERPSTIVSDALSGASSDDTRRRTVALLKRHTIPIHDEPWYKLDFHNVGVKAVSCQQCPFAIKRDAGVFCPDQPCTQAKRRFHARSLLQAAFEATRIQPAEQPYYSYGEHESFSYESHGPAILAAQPRCPNLRLVMLTNEHRSNFAQPDGFPDVAIVCQKSGNHQCSCLRKAKQADAATGAGNSTKPAILNKEIIQPAADMLALYLADIHPGILRLLGDYLRIDNGYGTNEAPVNVVDIYTPAEVVSKLARAPFERHCKEWRSPANNRLIAEQLLNVAGLRAPWLPPVDDNPFPVL